MTSKRVGVIGGGQLAWMLAIAGRSLNVEVIVQTDNPDDPAVSAASQVVWGNTNNLAATTQLAALTDIITFENEFIDLTALAPLAEAGVCFRPSLPSLAPLLDKWEQRRYLKDIGLPVPLFFPGTAISEAIARLGWPLVIKVRRHGYDGQGTFIAHNQEELNAIERSFRPDALMVEQFIPFAQELAAIAARSLEGDLAVYPVVETQQDAQVCRRVLVPATVGNGVQGQVEVIARQLLSQLALVGVVGIELFLTQEGQVLINEIAPRTHNSGHYTLDTCSISQFEMQLRCVTGLAIAPPVLTCPAAVMVNLLGYEVADSDYWEKRQQLADIPGASVYWYGKKTARPGRKLGHVTVVLGASDPSLTLAIARQIEQIWYS